MIRKKFKGAIRSEYHENHPEIFKMAEYIYKRPENNKTVKYYTLPIDARHYVLTPKSMNDVSFNKRHSNKISSVYSKTIDEFTDNKVRTDNRFEPGYMHRRKHFISALNRGEQRNIFDQEYIKKPTSYRDYNILLKSRTTYVINLKKYKKQIKPVFTINYLKIPKNFMGDVNEDNDETKIENDPKSEDITVNNYLYDSKDFFIATFKAVGNDYLLNSTNTLRTNATKDDVNDYLLQSSNILRTQFARGKDVGNHSLYDSKNTLRQSSSIYIPSYIATFIFSHLPRFDTNLTRITSNAIKFDPYSTNYKFVSTCGKYIYIFISDVESLFLNFIQRFCTLRPKPHCFQDQLQ